MDLRMNRKDKFGILPNSSFRRLNEDNYNNLFVTNLPGATDENKLDSLNVYESVDKCETNDTVSNPIVIHDEIDYISIIWMLLLISIFVAGIRFLVYY